MKVRCIDAGDSDGELKLGEVYTLDTLTSDQDGTYFYLEGRDGGWNSRRFETLDAGFTPVPDAPAGDVQCDSHNFQPDGNGEWYCRKCRIPSAGTILAARAAGVPVPPPESYEARRKRIAAERTPKGGGGTGPYTPSAELLDTIRRYRGALAHKQTDGIARAVEAMNRRSDIRTSFALGHHEYQP